MSTADCIECQYQKRTGKPLLTSPETRANPALRNGDKVTIRSGMDAGKPAKIVGRDGTRVKVQLNSGTILSVRPQEIDISRRNPSGTNSEDGGGIAGTLLLMLGTLTLLFGLILPVVLKPQQAAAR